MSIDWATLVDAMSKCRPAALLAGLCLGRLKTSGWRPVKLRVAGGGVYVVKGLWRPGMRTHDDLPPGRTIFNENVAGRLGTFMHAPVPEVALVEVRQQLIDQYVDAMQHLRPGIAHGSRFIKDCVMSQPKHQVRNPIEVQNRPRYALLAIFFGWTNGSETALINDAEFLYDPGANVYGVDFGNFFGGPDWKDLAHLSSPAVPNNCIVNGCKLTREELADACENLRAVTPEQLAGAVAAPPDKWDVVFDDRVKLAKVLHARQKQLVTVYAMNRSAR